MTNFDFSKVTVSEVLSTARQCRANHMEALRRGDFGMLRPYMISLISCQEWLAAYRAHRR